MVELYGVVHGVSQTDFLGNRNPISLKPSEDFLNEIFKYSKGTKVGVEFFSDEDWEIVKTHLSNLTKGAVFSDSSFNYWTYIIEQCKKNEYEIVFLENKDVWFKHNKAVKKVADQNSKFKDLRQEEGESNIDYHMKLCTIETACHKAEIKAKQICEIERDNTILNNIKNNVDIAIVGLAHSDFWIANSQFIKKKHGIIFDSYSTDTPNDNKFFNMVFKKNAIPNPEIIYLRKGLEREINLIENGRITNATPDYVGIWYVTDPLKGYFELFINHEENGIIRGTIEDCLGSATFEGTYSNEEFNFVKKYTEHDTDAIKSNLIYKSKRDKKGFTGYYNVEGDWFKTAFYLIQASQEDPLNLTRYWAKANLKEEVTNNNIDNNKDSSNSNQLKIDFPDDLPF